MKHKQFKKTISLFTAFPIWFFLLLVTGGLLTQTLAQADEEGDLLWVNQVGGIDSDYGYSIAADSRGNALATGYFTYEATFGVGETNETTLTTASNRDAYIAKYAPDGSLLWVNQVMGSSFGKGITVDADDNVLVTGYFYYSVTFGAGETNETILTSGGSADIFIAKYTSDGLLLWAKQAGGTSYVSGSAITVDADGSALVTSSFYGSAIFGCGEANETILTSAGNSDIFIAKYGPDGKLIWAKQAGGELFDGGGEIAVDKNGNSIVAGGFSSINTIFGLGEENETTLTTYGQSDIFRCQPGRANAKAGSPR